MVTGCCLPDIVDCLGTSSGMLVMGYSGGQVMGFQPKEHAKTVREV
jgi:hypothetical protein